MSAPVLSVRGLRKEYGGRVVLDGIDLDVHAHDVVCLIGSSGSGKSTLLRCLDLLEEIDDGVIELEGREVSDPHVDPRDVRRSIGMVFQSYNLFPHLSVLANCTLSPVRVHGAARQEAEDRAKELLERFGLAEKAAAHPDQLSGGQQQRVACARAMVSRPAVIFADEPTGNLDSASGAEVLGFLRRSVDDFDQTIVMVTHDPLAASYTDRVIFLADGRVVDELRQPTSERVLEKMKQLSARTPVVSGAEA
jgi:polar amino acid transport system ATP-binding protein